MATLFRNKSDTKRTPLRWVLDKVLLLLFSYLVVLLSLAVWEFSTNRFFSKANHASAFKLSDDARANLSQAAHEKMVEFLNEKQIPRGNVRGLEILVSSFDFFRGGACGAYSPSCRQVWLKGDPYPWRSGLAHEIGHHVYGKILTHAQQENFRKLYDGYVTECLGARRELAQSKQARARGYGSLMKQTMAFTAAYNENSADQDEADDYDERFAVIYAAYYTLESSDAATSLGAARFRSRFGHLIDELGDEEEIEPNDFTLIVPDSPKDIPSLFLYYDRTFLGLCRWIR